MRSMVVRRKNAKSIARRLKAELRTAIWYRTACASKRVNLKETTRSLARPVPYHVRLVDFQGKAARLRVDWFCVRVVWWCALLKNQYSKPRNNTNWESRKDTKSPVDESSMSRLRIGHHSSSEMLDCSSAMDLQIRRATPDEAEALTAL